MRQELKIATAALLTDTRSDHSRGLGNAFAATFESLGGRVVARQYFSKGDSDFRAQLTAIRAAKPDVLFVPAYYNDVALIAIQARDLGMTQPLVGGDGWESPKLLELGGKALDGSYYSSHYFVDDPAPAVRTFVTNYQRRYGTKPDSLAALGYDAMKVLAEAMRHAPKLDAPSIRNQLATTANFVGVTGTISLGADRNPVAKKVIVLEVKNGALTLKKTIEPM
jgi:branched-chain amino acid transport system substrate-binding protein